MKVVLQRHDPITIVEGRNEDGDVTWLFEYYLQTYPNLSNDGKGRFGIKIVQSSSDRTFDKAAETFAITDNVDEAMAMIARFSKGAVRLNTLNDMVEEWFSEKALSRGGGPFNPASMSAWNAHYAG